MIEAIRSLWSALSNQVSRGRLVQSVYSPGGQRTMLQGIGFADEAHQSLELLLPYGRSAMPNGSTADYLVFQINAVRDHKVAIGADDPALRIPDLAGGEFGDRNGRGSQVVFRNNKIEVTAPLDDIDVTAAQGNVNVVASQGNVTVTATEGTVNVVGKGGVNVTVSAGNLAVTVTGNITLAATGSITLTGLTGQIKANGNVLG